MTTAGKPITVSPGNSRRWKYVTPLMRFEDGYIPEPNSGCWLWIKTLSEHGYGRMLINYRIVFAHRFSYQQFRGSLTDGLVLDHLCRNRCCVNPDHLEQVTQTENVRRGGKMLNASCPSGHPFTPENTWINPRNGWRQCRQCNRDNQARLAAKRSAA